MGDPKKQRKKYFGPSHPWQGKRIEEEKELLKEYGLKNKTEIWKTISLLRDFKRQAKLLTASETEQARKEESLLLAKLNRLNLLAKDSKLGDVLNLTTKDILERRLQTQVFKRGLARTPKQARQFLVHGHILIKDQKIDVPSYLVSTEEEPCIIFSQKSKLNKEDHPERIAVKKEQGKAVKPLKKKTDRAEKRKTQKVRKETKEHKKESKKETQTAKEGQK